MSILQAPFEESEILRGIRDRASRLARSDLPICVEGEPGTGRRTLADSLLRQRQRERSDNVVAIEGVEGITERVRALFREHGTTQRDMIVYNIEALSPIGQAELVSLLRSKRIRLLAISRAGSDDNEPRRPLSELDAELTSTKLQLPPLRERGDDIAKWANHFLSRASERLGVFTPILNPNAIQALRNHRWPGNLIELEAVLSRAVCLSHKSIFGAMDLDLPDPEGTEPIIKPLVEAVDEFRAAYVAKALAHYSGNRTQTARALGVDPRTIFRYLESKKKAEGE